VAPNICGPSLGVELASSHPSGTKNFDVAPRFLVNLCTNDIDTATVYELNMSFLVLLFCTTTNKCTIISRIITLLHVSTLSCPPKGACNQ